MSVRIHQRASGWVAALAMLGACSRELPKDPAARGAVLYGQCVQCHSADGSGNRLAGAPSIAGQNLWYVKMQLRKFRNGTRGAHPDDVMGLRMRPMSRLLDDAADIDAVAQHIARLPPARPSPVLEGGDPERGKTRYATCMACHGADGAGMEVQKSPDLIHAADWYLLAQLQKFRSGIRGADPRDITGMLMRPQAMMLPDDQAMKDVIAYIQTLPN